MVLKAPGPTTKYAFSATALFIQSPQFSTERKNLKSFFFNLEWIQSRTLSYSVL